jgi:magnesium transporter
MTKTFLISPSEEELNEIAAKLGVEKEVLLSALDENALSRVHFNKITALYVDIPFVTNRSKQTIYRTSPVGLFFTEEHFVMVANRELALIDKMKKENRFHTENGMDFMLLALNDITETYLIYLKDFYNKIERLEEQLKKNLSNNGIFQLMEYQRSLTDLATSISGIKRLLNKIEEKSFAFKNENILDDTIVAAEQANEMAHIYSEDLDSLMDAFGSVISNNVNSVMKILTSLTLIIAIPTLVAGLYGMNVSHLPLAEQPYAFWAILGGSVVFSIILGIVFYFKKML